MPTNAFLKNFAGALIVGAVSLSILDAQARAAPQVRGAQELATAWSALAGGKPAEAERVADAMLKATPRSHDGVALKMRARVASHNVGGALDAYEGWLGNVAQHEDAFLLEPVAVGVLEAFATSNDPVVRTRALELLAALGEQSAIDKLNAAAADSGSVRTDIALARRGDASAVQRLAQQVKAGGTRDVSSVIDALREGHAKGAAGVIASALDPARPLPTKLAAARALAELGGANSIPRLKEALKDPDPPVRFMAAAALARLGDDTGAELVKKLEGSPVGDLRLLVAEGSAAGNPTGEWVTVATGVLQDSDPLVRLRAAELIVRHAADPGPGLQVLEQSLSDSNIAMRSAAAQSLERLPGSVLERDLPMLRKLLRDASPMVQIEAAGGILKVIGAV